MSSGDIGEKPRHRGGRGENVVTILLFGYDCLTWKAITVATVSPLTLIRSFVEASSDNEIGPYQDPPLVKKNTLIEQEKRLR